MWLGPRCSSNRTTDITETDTDRDKDRELEFERYYKVTNCDRKRYRHRDRQSDRQCDGEW